MNKDELTDWIATLTVPQMRALASQAGIKQWSTIAATKLQEKLRQNANVVDIYEANFGG